MRDQSFSEKNSFSNLDIALDNISEAKKNLKCIKSVRRVPGKRLVCEGRWQGQDVFAKLYFGSKRAERNWRKELNGFETFASKGIAAPSIIHSGTAEHGKFFVLIMEPVPAGQSLQALWNQKETDAERISILQDVIAVLARHHEAGLLQRDLHLNNFMSSNGTIFTLDCGDLRIQKSPLGLRRSLSNLGLLFAQLFPEYDRFVTPLFISYMNLRGLPANPSKENDLRAYINSLRQARLHKYLKKIFRECTEFVCEKNFHHFTVYRRDCASKELEAFLACPDATLLMPKTRILKKGNTATVWLTPIASRNLIVKRYNIKGFMHWFQQGLRISRAALSWKNAHLLKFFGLQTAFPIAFVEERYGFLRKRSYFITEQMDGIDYRSLFQDKGLSDLLKKDAAKRVIGLLFKLRDLKVSHGDMKATNIFSTTSGPSIIDLDSMRHFKSKIFFKHHHLKDKQRLLKNWQPDTDLKNLFAEILLKDSDDAM